MASVRDRAVNFTGSIPLLPFFVVRTVRFRQLSGRFILQQQQRKGRRERPPFTPRTTI